VGKHAGSGSSPDPLVAAALAHRSGQVGAHGRDHVQESDGAVGWPGPAPAPGGRIGWPADL
jgi:hypothetical protein